MTDLPADHVFPVRVYYEDTDAGGVVYYANYLRFAERARTEMMRDCGIDHTTLLQREGVILAVRRCEADYVRPARLDDLLAVHTRFTKTSGASLWMEQTVRRNHETIAEMQLRIVCLHADGRPARLPQALRSAVSANTPATPH